MSPQIQIETANKTYKNKSKAHHTETEEYQKQRESLKVGEAVRRGNELPRKE